MSWSMTEQPPPRELLTCGGIPLHGWHWKPQDKHLQSLQRPCRASMSFLAHEARPGQSVLWLGARIPPSPRTVCERLATLVIRTICAVIHWQYASSGDQAIVKGQVAAAFRHPAPTPCPTIPAERISQSGSVDHAPATQTVLDQCHVYSEFPIAFDEFFGPADSEIDDPQLWSRFRLPSFLKAHVFHFSQHGNAGGF